MGKPIFDPEHEILCDFCDSIMPLKNEGYAEHPDIYCMNVTVMCHWGMHDLNYETSPPPYEDRPSFIHAKRNYIYCKDCWTKVMARRNKLIDDGKAHPKLKNDAKT